MEKETLKKVADVIRLKQNNLRPILTDYDIQMGFTIACNINTSIDTLYDYYNDKLSDEYWVTDSKFNCNSKAYLLYCLSLSSKVTFYTMLPASTQTQWWYNYCRFADVVFVKGRIAVKGYVQPVSRAVVVFSPEMHKRAPTTSYLEL